MMGERTVAQEALFYEFSLERHVPADHLLRSTDRFVDLTGIREQLRPLYSEGPAGPAAAYQRRRTLGEVAVRIAEHLRLSPMLIGLTIVRTVGLAGIRLPCSQRLS